MPRSCLQQAFSILGLSRRAVKNQPDDSGVSGESRLFKSRPILGPEARHRVDRQAERESLRPLLTQTVSNSTFRPHVNSFDGRLQPPSPQLFPRIQSPSGSSRTSQDIYRGSVLRTALLEARIELPPRQLRYFVPANVLENLLQPTEISAELLECQLEFVSDESRLDLGREISAKAPKLFAILVCLRLGHFISDFLDDEINDDDLPFERSYEIEKPGKWILCSKRNLKRPIQCMLEWDSLDISNFDREQWYVLSPVFKESEEHEVPHYQLSDNCVLPFIEDEEQSCPRIGGFSTVWRVVIHQAHQELYQFSKHDGQPPSIAVKRLNSTDEKDFRLEVEMLKAFSKHKHPHLVRLLATYHLKNAYYLLFPYAKYNLRSYWEHTPLPRFDTAMLSWSLHQCKAIASGLYLIHEHKGTHDLEDWPLKDNHTYGRHGDIKPENILWSMEVDKIHKSCCLPEKGFLLIADFGLMDSHKRLTRSRILAGNIGGSQTYEPPETRLEKKVSRAYDIWSLGCLYLEFIIWLVLGWDALKLFHEARNKTDSPGISEDTFYTIIIHPGNKAKAIVRKSVVGWIEKLHQNERCSAFIHDFLELVQNDMLDVDRSIRIGCGPLNDKLRQMVDQSRMDPTYLAESRPRTPRQPSRSFRWKDPHPPYQRPDLKNKTSHNPGGLQLLRRGGTT